MTDLELLKLAKEAGLILTAERETPGWSAPLPGATYPDRLERFANLIRAEVLEEAAGVCENTLAQHYMKQVIPTNDEALLLAACADCAAAIRALKGQT